MNFEPIISKKELAAKVGCSVRTLTDHYGRQLEAARCKALQKPTMYFAPKAVKILVAAGAVSLSDD